MKTCSGLTLSAKSTVSAPVSNASLAEKRIFSQHRHHHCRGGAFDVSDLLHLCNIFKKFSEEFEKMNTPAQNAMCSPSANLVFSWTVRDLETFAFSQFVKLVTILRQQTQYPILYLASSQRRVVDFSSALVVTCVLVSLKLFCSALF